MERFTLFAAVVMLIATPVQAMQIMSPDFADGSAMAVAQIKCGGGNVSPALHWSGEPAGTKSFALTMFDPDAHGGWWHWIVLDIPADVHAMASGAGSGSGLPQGAVPGLNDFHDPGYDGPCPPPGSGTHHYEITLWAMPDARTSLGANPTGAEALAYVQLHAVAHAQTVGTYKR